MLTNKLNLPEPLLRAAERDRYSRGDADYSVTELIKPARMAALERLYRDVIIEDVADHMWSLLGRIGHGILEASGAPETGAILEERLYTTVSSVRISGAMDHTVLLPTGCLDDYKFTSVWAILDGIKPEWEAQLNIYAWLRALNGQAVTKLRVIAILRDWSIAKARTDQGRYPKEQVVALDVPMWEGERVQEFVEGRVRAHREADLWAQGEHQTPAPLCSDSERWTRPIKWAMIKKGAKRATKLYDTEGEARYAANGIAGATVVRRGGDPVRCYDYCSPGRAGLCTQFEEYKRERENDAKDFLGEDPFE